MAEDNKAAEAVEAAAKAVEALEEADKGDRPSVGLFADHKLRSLAALILASASLIATLGTFLKTCDHSVTEEAYNTLATNIVKLSDNQEKVAQDVANIHGYLEGMRGSQVQGQFGALITFVDAGAPTFVPIEPIHSPFTKSRPVPSTSATSTLSFNVFPSDAGIYPAPAAVTLAPASPPPAPVKPPAFSDAIGK